MIPSGTLLLVAQIGLLAFAAKAQTPVESSTAARTVTLTGIVRDSSGTALGAVEVVVDSTYRDITNTKGEFTIAGLPPGAIQFTARRFGYVPLTSIVEADAGLVVQLAIKLAPGTVELETVVVEGKRLNRTLVENGYYRRANLGMGHFLRPEQLDRSAASISTLLSMMPSVTVTRNRRGEAGIAGRKGGGTCTMSIFVDGTYIRYADIGLDNIIGRYDVLAVEVYPRANQIPARFLGSGNSHVDCGAVFMWTKPVQVRSETTRPNP